MKVNTISTEEDSSISKATDLDTMVTTTLTDSYPLYCSAEGTSGALEFQNSTSSENEDAMLYEDATFYYSAKSHANWFENHSSQHRLAHNEQMVLASCT